MVPDQTTGKLIALYLIRSDPIPNLTSSPADIFLDRDKRVIQSVFLACIPLLSKRIVSRTKKAMEGSDFITAGSFLTYLRSLPGSIHYGLPPRHAGIHRFTLSFTDPIAPKLLGH